MARSVFFSFHYKNDITRVMVVRNRWVTHGGQIVSGVIDHAAFMQVQSKGDAAIKRWINQQMEGTTATVVLIGSETLKRYYVQYEILHSLERGNAIIGVYINHIKDWSGRTSLACNSHTEITCIGKNKPIYFDEIADGIYDYQIDDGYHNLGRWVEDAL